MAGITRVGFVTVLSLALFAGCNRSASSNTAETPADGGDKASQIDPATDPIAHAAADFLDAVLKGDTQRGSARLTPKAKERIAATGKKFDPPGLENPSFRIIAVRTPSQDHAFVQCELSYTGGGTNHQEEMCCELRQVDNDWRVSGIAYETAPDKPWTLSDFESGRDIPVSRQPTPETNASTAGTDGAAGRPSPPRTAQQTPATAPAIERR